MKKQEFNIAIPVGVLVAISPIILGSLVGYTLNKDRGDNKDQQWYSRPRFTPPPVVFSVVWPILYLLLGASAFVAAFRRPTDDALLVYLALAVNMAFNLSFPVAQMGMKNLDLARTSAWGTFVTSAVLVLVYVYVSDFGGAAAPLWKNVLPLVLVAPYVLWCAFATVLMTSIHSMNRGHDGDRRGTLPDF